MAQRNYHRDIWALGPTQTGYPGGFPTGLVNAVRRKWWGKDRLWLFSGSFKDPSGVTVDIKPELEPKVVANCEDLPFEDNSFDFVFADPPYSEAEARELYGLPYCNVVKVLNEMARVCKPGGHVLFLHRLVPQNYPLFSKEWKKLEMKAVVGIYIIGGMTNIRALTVWQKRRTLDEWTTGISGKITPPKH